MKDNKNTNKRIPLKKKIRRFIFRIVWYVLVLAGALVGLLKLLELIKTKLSQYRNIRDGIKQYYKVAGLLDIKPDSYIEGLVIQTALCAVNIDLTQCELKDNSFISYTGLASAVNIIIPDDFTVYFDGITNGCVVKKCSDEKLPQTIYIAVKANACAINIKHAGEND